MQASTEGKYKLKTLKISAVAIFSVVIVEVSVGLIVNSLAILSDGLHALLDALSTVMLFIAVRAALKPPDDEHPYGHEKFETIGGLIGGIVLIAVAFLIFYEAAMRIISQAQVSQSTELFGFIGIGYALFIASLRVTVFRGSQHIESTSMKAGLYDAISDLSSTLLALVGFALSVSGFYYGDSIASIFLGIMLSYLSARLVRASIMELSDTASKDLVQKTRRIIEANAGDAKIKTLKVRKVSSKIFVDMCLQILRYTSLEDAHSFATKIETKLKEELGNVEATTHIEPLEKDNSFSKREIDKLFFLQKN
jgi:cation diffusion facilitator family transporter